MIEVNNKIDIKSLSPAELSALLKDLNEPAYRAKQVFEWLQKGCSSFEEMTNLSLALRNKLKEYCHIYGPTVERKLVSTIDGTIKYLWNLWDGNAVETVLMRYHHGNTVCISTQVGCRQGCAFCASTIGGLIRSLTPSEMLDEVLFTENDSGLKVNNIVLMGIGEPLDNFDNVIRFLHLINEPSGRNIGMRHISLSTCGLTERFDELAALNLQLTLSVSLHAPDDETRNRIMPTNRGRGVELLFKKCSDYYSLTGRRISFEYAMIDGVTDSVTQAEMLASKVKNIGGHVNLIPLNYVEERPFKPSTPENMKRFISILEKQGINVTVRRKLGSDVDASCGQLRRKTIRDEKR